MKNIYLTLTRIPSRSAAEQAFSWSSQIPFAVTVLAAMSLAWIA